MTAEPASHAPQLHLVASGGQGVLSPHFAPVAAQAATLDEVAVEILQSVDRATLDDIAVAIADVASMPVADAVKVLERARLALPREVAAVRSIFGTLAAFQAAGA